MERVHGLRRFANAPHIMLLVPWLAAILTQARNANDSHQEPAPKPFPASQHFFTL